MTVVGSSQCFGDQDMFLQYAKPILQEQKELGKLEATFLFGSEKLLDYQKELFLDAISDLVGGLQAEGLTFEKVKKIFEATLQEVNVKLAAFAEKMQDKGPFPIQGIMQLFRGSEYIAGLVGQTSVVILRNKRIHYRVCQALPEPRPRIDRFNELLEGELKADDQLLVVGLTLETYMDKTDVQTIIEQAEIEEQSVEQMLVALLKTRVDPKKIGFTGSYELEEAPLFAEYRMGRTFMKLVDRFGSKLGSAKKYQAFAIYVAAGLGVLLMLTWIMQSFITSTSQRFTTSEGGIVMDLSIEDIQKDIATFKRIDPSSDQKIKKYNEIIAQLDLLDKHGKWSVDVKKLRGILEKDYLDGFNIESILDIKESMQPVYTFTPVEKTELGEVSNLYWNKGLFVVGKSGVLLNAVDDQVRGTLVSVGIERKINTCTLNLLKNGLYCAMSDGNLFNVLRSGLQPLSTEGGLFPTGIKSIATFGSSFFYTLQSKPATGSGSSIAITKYANKRGSSEEFGAGTTYDIQPDPKFAKASSGIQQLTVDGAFLSRSAQTASLRQLWRPGTTPSLVVREIPLQGGDTLRAPGKNAKVFSFSESRFVYVWDPETQIFTVYRSSPFKTNDAHTTDYVLPYFFSIKFAADTVIKDVFVEDGEKASLYIMTDSEVRKLALDELRNKFFEKEQNEAKEKEMGVQG